MARGLHPLAGGLPALRTGRRRTGRPPLRRGACAGGRQPPCCCSPPASTSRAWSPARSAGAFRLDDHATEPRLDMHPARVGQPRWRRQRGLLPHRAPDLHPAARGAQAVFTIHVESRPLAEGDHERGRSRRAACRAGIDERCRARLSRPDQCARSPARLAGRARGMKTAPIVAARIERSPKACPRRGVRRRLPPARRRARTGAPRLPRRQRSARTLARPRALRHRRDRLRPGQQLPRCVAPGATIPHAASGSTSLSVELHPPSAADLAHGRAIRLLLSSPRSCTQWLPLTHDLHRLSFEGGRVPAARLRRRGRMAARVGGASTPSSSTVSRRTATRRCGGAPVQSPRSLAAPGATAATWSSARAVRDALHSAGFEVDKAAGSGKRDISVARFAPEPRHVQRARRRRAGRARRPVEPRALIVGGGTAGCGARGARRARLALHAVRPPRRTGQRRLGQPGRHLPRHRHA